MPARELTPEKLRRSCDPEELGFETTEELEPLDRTLGQERARASFEFGVGIHDEGYNIFAHGASGLGKLTVIRRFLERRAADLPTPDDWCYIYNFEQDHSPDLLRLPAGRGRELARDMQRLVIDLGTALGSTFEGEEYQTRRQVIEEGLKDRQEKAVTAVGKEAEEAGLTLLRTPMGMVFAPVHDGKVLSPEEFGELSEEEQQRVQKEIERFQEELQKISRQIPRWQREARQQAKELHREITRFAVHPLIDELREHFREIEAVLAYIDAVEKDVVEQAEKVLSGDGESLSQKLRQLQGVSEGDELPILRRYRVNVLVDHGETEGAPVVFEDNPTYPNLVGRIEHLSKMGALVTDFTLIKAGSLHLANGGYLLIEARKLLTQAYAWEGLKRALQSHQIKIESIGQALSLVSVFTLEPAPAPLDLKVVLVGEPYVYYLLAQYDPDFGKLFKVAADFDEQIDRDAEGLQGFAQMMAELVRRHELPAFDRGAVARVIEQASRSLEDSEKLSLHLDHIADLMREAVYWAGKAERTVVAAEDVQRALDERDERTSRIRSRVYEQILRGTVLVDTEGEVVGQVNGLSVLMLGEVRFGKPSRITAGVRLGKGEMLDIEREVELGGPLHSKGVLILSSFLGARYAADRPLSLAASLVFEQSYGGVDGDSASSAELYALLSAISGLPIRQSLAVTGSVNQHGEVQAIGGVNEKIEGFFEICSSRGLSGDQGVLIPESNVQHLMLRHEVVEAVREGRFHVYPVRTIDEGIEILTGVEAGTADEEGAYPEGTVNARVADRLGHLAKIWQELSSSGGSGGEYGSDEGAETEEPE